MSTHARSDSKDVPLVPRRILGRTGLEVSCLAFGAGPVSGLMTGDNRELQHHVLQTLTAHGINWIDTAAGYGNGTSESNLGVALAALPPETRKQIHVATKVRIDSTSALPLADQIERSVEDSLTRLQLSKLTLLQLHNGITARTNDQPASLSVSEVLKLNGVAEVMQQVRSGGLADFIGLTGTGDSAALRAVVRSGVFDTIQIPFNLLNPSAGTTVDDGSVEQNYGNILADCQIANMGCFAIRVFAGGAILNQPPSSHTLRTPFFPLDLYQRDLERARKLSGSGSDENLLRDAIRFVLAHPAIHSAIIGFGLSSHVAEAAGIFGSR